MRRDYVHCARRYKRHAWNRHSGKHLMSPESFVLRFWKMSPDSVLARLRLVAQESVEPIS